MARPGGVPGWLGWLSVGTIQCRLSSHFWSFPDGSTPLRIKMAILSATLFGRRGHHHVAWRGDEPPENSIGLIDRVRGTFIDGGPCAIKAGFVVNWTTRLKSELSRVTSVMARIRQIFEFRLSLEYVHPTVWRRILVPDDCTLARLHKIIQAVMNWQDYHLHEFTVQGQAYGDPEV